MGTLEFVDQETELKERLKDRIDSTHNLGLLRGVLSLFDEMASEGVYVLSPEEEKMLDEAEKEPCISAEEAKRRTRECLDSLAKSFS